MSIGNLLAGAGIIVLIIYFARRMFWLSESIRHNQLTEESEKAAKEFDKSHDWISWFLLALGAVLVLGSSVCSCG